MPGILSLALTLMGLAFGSLSIVAEAADGRQAVDVIREHDPDLVFLDVQMPGLTGLEVVSEVGADRMPPVVFVTAYDEYAVKAFETSAIDYLVKPFEPEDGKHCRQLVPLGPVLQGHIPFCKGEELRGGVGGFENPQAHAHSLRGPPAL